MINERSREGKRLPSNHFQGGAEGKRGILLRLNSSSGSSSRGYHRDDADKERVTGIAARTHRGDSLEGDVPNLRLGARERR